MTQAPNASGAQPSDVPGPPLRERLIVAPVGNQPAAVLAPLLTPPLRPEKEDRVILIASQDSAGYARRIAEELGRNDIPCETTMTSLLPSDAAFATIEQAARDRETWLLANGGPVQWMLPLVDGLQRAARNVEIVVSRDHRAFVLDRAGRVRQELVVRDLGLERLLELLDLELRCEEKAMALVDGQKVLPDIVHLEEKSGLLYIALDASKWGKGNLDGRYRPRLLDWRELQHKGLDRRRVLLLGAPPELGERARGDGFVLATERFGLPEWKAAIGEGRAADLPETMDTAASSGIAPEIPAEIVDAGSWTGDPLVVVMGPQPGTTLRALWCHEPSAALILFDEAQPDSRRLTQLVANKLRRRAGEIVCRSYRSPDPLASWSQRDVDVHLTPGDKMTKLLLWLWTAQDPARRSRWTLEDNRSCRQGSSSIGRKIGSPVPLDVWVELHAPTGVEITPASNLDEIIPLANEVLRWLGDLSAPPPALSRLWNRVSHGPPSLDGDVLHWPDRTSRERLIPLSDLPPGFANACRPKEGGANGQWFEWIVVAALKQAGLDEVALNVTYRKPELQAEHFRDELDIVTRHERTYGVWSCKTEPTDIKKHARAARAQSDRLLGRQSLAVLVVPRLAGGQSPDGFAESAPGHWYRREVGHIIDARFLVSGDLAKLACHFDYHPGSVAAP